MKKPVEPEGGWPWLKPGFTFQIGWPPGFVASDRKPGEMSAQERSRIAAKSRDKQLANGHTGGLSGLSKKSDERLEMTRAKHIERARKP